jgi:hypothetical protein
MPASLENIKTAMARSARPGNVPRWRDLQADFIAATSSPLSAEVERLLLAILRFDGELQLDEASEMPHRMSPENMLKSLAVQALGRWTGATYLPTMRRLEATATPASFACVVRAVIQKVISGKGKPRHVEAVAELRSVDLSHALQIDYGGSGQAEITEYDLGDRTRREALAVLPAFGMTSTRRAA